MSELTPSARGIHRGLSAETYRGLDSLNFSTMRHMLAGPAYYQAALTAPPQPASPAMIMGSCLHSAVLEGREYPHVVAAEGQEFRSAADKSWKAAQTLPLLRYEEEQTWKAMERAVLGCRESVAVLAACPEREVSVFTEYRGLKLKARFDAVDFKRGLLLDLKSTSAKSPKEWGESVWEYSLLLQMEWYRLLFTLVTGSEPPRFTWLTVQNCAPFAVSLFVATEAQSEIGRMQLATVIDTYLRCQESGKWHSDQTFALPRWAEQQILQQA